MDLVFVKLNKSMIYIVILLRFFTLVFLIIIFVLHLLNFIVITDLSE